MSYDGTRYRLPRHVQIYVYTCVISHDICLRTCQSPPFPVRLIPAEMNDYLSPSRRPGLRNSPQRVANQRTAIELPVIVFGTW